MTNNNLLYYLNENNLLSGVTLRNATKDDIDNMFKWKMETVDKSIRNDPKTIRYIKKDVQESIKLTKMIMYNGETIGMFTTDRLEPGSDWWYIGEIYIVKEHRNKGIGTALLKEEISKHDKIKLMVSYSNTSAMKLYKSLGFEVTDKNDKGGMYIMSLDKTKSKSINEACKDLKSAREFVSKVGELAKKYNANYFIVTDGASGIHNDGNPAVKNARDSQIKWEKEHGFDPDEDWSKDKSVNEHVYINDYYLQEGNIRNTIGRKLNNIDVKINKVNDTVFDATDSIIKQGKEECKDSKIKKIITTTTIIAGLPPIISIPSLIAIKNWDKIVKLRKSMIATSVKERRKINSDADFATNFAKHGIVSAVVSASVGKIIDKITDIIDKDKNKYHTPEPSIGYTKDDKPILLRYYENRVLPIEVYAKLNEEGRPKEEIDSIIFSPYNLRPYSSKSLPKNYILYQVAYCDDKYNVILVVEDLDRVKKYLEEQGETLDSYLEKGKSYKFTISNKYCTIPEKHNIYDIKEHGFDPDEDWSKESINETMELYLTRPKYLFKKNITLYHGTNKKIPNKVIDPKYGTINAGTRLSNPRYSTWWTDDEFFALTIDIYDIFMKEYDIPSAYVAYEFINIDYRNKIIYINKDNANQVKNLLNKSEKYVYIATVPTSIVGRGHNYNIDEYTIDVPIKADKEIKVTYDMLKPYIKIIPKEEFQTSDMIKNHILVHNANNKLNAIELLIYKDDFGYIRQYNKFLSQLGEFNEQVSILNEVKQFPIEFDKEGNLIIYKSRIGSLAFGDEIDDSVQLLQVYRNSSNIEGMKYELAKLWYINDCIEKKLKKRLSNDEYKELIDTRATCLNVFKTNLDYVMKTEKGFNFSDYYNSTPFSDNSVKITANTLKYAAKTIAGMI